MSGWNQQNFARLRREKVARLRARGFTALEILDEFSRPEDEGGVRNPRGDPYSLSTIESDFAILDREWQASALRTTTEMKGKILAELEMVKREAWKIGMTGDIKGLTLVIKALARESLLFGLNEPFRVSMYNLNIDISQLDEQQLARLAAGEDPAQVLGTQLAQVVEGEVVQSSRGVSEDLSPHESCSSEEKEEADLGEGRLGEGEDG